MTWWDNTPTLTTVTPISFPFHIIVSSSSSMTGGNCRPDELGGRIRGATKLVDDFAQTCRRRLEEIYAWTQAALKAARSLSLAQRLPPFVFHDRALGRAGRSCSLSDKWRVRGPP